MTTAEAARRLRDIKTIDQTTRLAVERAIAAAEEVDAAWVMIDHGWDIETRDDLERQAATNGFTFGLAQAIHHLHKRCVKDNPEWLKVTPQPKSRIEQQLIDELKTEADCDTDRTGQIDPSDTTNNKGHA